MREPPKSRGLTQARTSPSVTESTTPLRIQAQARLKDKTRREISERRQVGDAETLVHQQGSSSRGGDDNEL
ncbi:uncharacterized protein SPSK_02107 [Sporothrix schenckii 1099-18]|uniref:Uncharacterized protein n=2 Tax=Sporothrix schenckii TaxID=29908 RepID=U7PL97_SPOS1|nr:uncharacterized protein SPSK_02107 [Sporothrix schenckii 1099-18]ERS96352.1 hypothetical protein HMPREF1624_07262 [Sporothrix schenckii ATCC 58251]KJR87071.1 hypothetical protein SPSK_02107 [Sporothrix schenckii 1099-18]